MTAHLFTLAVALTTVLALLSHCAAGLAVSVGTAYAVALPLLVAAMHALERNSR